MCAPWALIWTLGVFSAALNPPVGAFVEPLFGSLSCTLEYQSVFCACCPKYEKMYFFAGFIYFFLYLFFFSFFPMRFKRYAHRGFCTFSKRPTLTSFLSFCQKLRISATRSTFSFPERLFLATRTR